jgi:ABC-2 type transport system permease protein
MRFINLFLRSTQLSMHRELAYRVNFVLKLLGIITLEIFKPIFIVIMYSVSLGLPGWDLYELILFSAIFSLVTGLGATLFYGVAYRTIGAVEGGTFDNILLKPYGTLTFLLARSVSIGNLGTIIAGLGVFIFALSKVTTPSPINFVFFLVVLGLGLLFILSFIIFVSAFSLHFVHSETLIDLFSISKRFGLYPITIYGTLGTFVFTFIVPFGLAAHYPIQALFGSLSIILFSKLVLVAASFFTVAYIFWRFSITKYTSAGG